MAYPGLHKGVMALVPVPSGTRRAIDLGCGTGAFTQRLAEAGWAAEGADVERNRFRADLPFHLVDLNDPQSLPNDYELVTAIEVIEHTENPTEMLRTVAQLLVPDGLAIVTTPNVDSLRDRLRFAAKGKIRAMDEWGDPTHITPIFLSLLPRLLKRAGLCLVRRESYQTMSKFPWSVINRVDPLAGECHIFLLRRDLATVGDRHST